MPELTDWSRFRQCPVCRALLGKPCGQLSGRNTTVVWLPVARPHSTRKLRTGYARTGGDR